MQILPSKRYRWVSRVCVVHTVYTLLIYLLISTEDEIKHTYFFFSDGVPNSIYGFFRNQSFYYVYPKNYMRRFLYDFFINFPLKFPFLLRKDISVWGQAQLPYSRFIIRNHKIHIIEDGTRNYFPSQLYGNKFSKIINAILRQPEKREYAFMESWCEEEILTGIIKDSPAMQSSKLRLISLTEQWKLSSLGKRKLICDVFGVTEDDIDFISSREKLLITQPMSEDFLISEKEKIEYYSNKIKEIGTDGLLIKTHPREITKYEEIFPDIPVFRKKIPMELLSICGANIKEAYTDSSTAIFLLPESTKKTIWNEIIDLNYEIELRI